MAALFPSPGFLTENLCGAANFAKLPLSASLCIFFSLCMYTIYVQCLMFCAGLLFGLYRILPAHQRFFASLMACGGWPSCVRFPGVCLCMSVHLAVCVRVYDSVVCLPVVAEPAVAVAG